MEHLSSHKSEEKRKSSSGGNNDDDKESKELNYDEFFELRSSYFLETNNDFRYADEISDETIINHYEGIYFVKEDFFCNLK